MTSPILVTGGTGTLGRLVVTRLRDSGCDVRVLSRSHREAADRIEFVTGDLASAVAAPLGALAGVVDFAVLADMANGDNGGIFDGIIGDPDNESEASGTDGKSDTAEIV